MHTCAAEVRDDRQTSSHTSAWLTALGCGSLSGGDARRRVLEDVVVWSYSSEGNTLSGSRLGEADMVMRPETVLICSLIRLKCTFCNPH